MKKLYLLPLVLVLLGGIILSSCGPAATTTPTGPGAPTVITVGPSVTTAPAPTTAAPTPTRPTATTAAPTAAPTPVKPYGTIRVATPDFSYESTDPVYYESFWGWSMYDSLLTYDNQGNIIPNVAESFSLSPDGVWTFKIRKGIKFHNGDPLTAHDVKFSVDRFGDMSLSTNPWSWYISPQYNKKDSIVVDDYTYKFVSDHPEPAQAIVFAWTRILPKNYYEKVGMEEFRKHPIGSGPWKFVKHVPETRFEMEANTEYWGQVPYYEKVIEVQVPEEATRIAMLKRGELDICLGLNYDRIKQLKQEGFRTETIGLPVLSNITFQGTWLPQAGPTHDIRVRKAMSYALNREEIAATWYQGFARPGGQFFMHKGGYGWTDDLAADPYDPEKAKALLKEAGYPNAFTDPTIHYYTTPPGQDYALLLIGYWEEVGLQVKLEILDSVVWGGYFFSFKRLQGDEPNVGWVFPWTYQSYFNSTYHCSNMYTSWGTHNAGNDPKADELYLKATKEIDPVKAREYYAEFQKYARSMYVNVGIVEADSMILVANTLGKFTNKTWVSLNDVYNYIQHP